MYFTWHATSTVSITKLDTCYLQNDTLQNLSILSRHKGLVSIIELFPTPTLFDSMQFLLYTFI